MPRKEFSYVVLLKDANAGAVSKAHIQQCKVCLRHEASRLPSGVPLSNLKVLQKCMPPVLNYSLHSPCPVPEEMGLG